MTLRLMREDNQSSTKIYQWQRVTERTYGGTWVCQICGTEFVNQHIYSTPHCPNTDNHPKPSPTLPSDLED